MSLKRFLKLNFKIGLLVGIMGLMVYIIFSPTERKNDKNYTHYIYNSSSGNAENAKYVKKKSKLYLLSEKRNTSSANYGEDIFFLNNNNKAWILDTIENEIVKFRAKKMAQDSSLVVIRGYTRIENIHEKKLD